MSIATGSAHREPGGFEAGSAGWGGLLWNLAMSNRAEVVRPPLKGARR